MSLIAFVSSDTTCTYSKRVSINPQNSVLSCAWNFSTAIISPSARDENDSKSVTVLSYAQNFSTANVSPSARDENDSKSVTVLSYTQNLSTANILPSARDENDSKSVTVNPQNLVLSCAQNFSTAKVSASARDENSLLDDCLFAVFEFQSISNDMSHTCPLHNIVPIVPTDATTFGLISAFFLASILRYFSLCYILHLRKFVLSLLVNQVCDICTVMNVAYVFNEQWKSLLRRVHSFWNVVFRKLDRNSDAASMSPCLQYPHVGGGARKGIAWSSIEGFVYSFPSSFTCGKVLYMALVNQDCLQRFPTDKYIFARVPLSTLVDLVPLVDARSIVAMHGISPGSRCNAAVLKSCVAEHNCSECPGYVTVFSILEKDAETKSIERTVRYRANFKLKTKSVQVVTTDQSQTLKIKAQFPPEPASRNFELNIMRNACKRMDPKHFEEVGCAVCGELKPCSDSSRLKSVKNILGILETPGVTRVERKTDKCPIKEYRGPVLDYNCSYVCNECRGDLRKGKIPKVALSNNLWLGTVPDVLKKLTFVEKMLVAKVRHTCAFVKVASGMRKMKANIVAFESPIRKIYNILPPPREDLDEVLAILFTGPCKPTAEDFARTPFLVRRNAIIAALEWLRLNHADYEGIQISQENVMQYEENMPPVSVEYRECVTNKVAEGTSVFDQEEEDGTVEGDCAFTVHGLTGENFNSMTPTALKALALRHLNSGGKMLAVGHSDKFQSMWNNPQLYPQMFPWLFPYGLGGIGGTSTRISEKEHKRHLLMYHDKRFQVDVNFPFVAFSHEQVKTSTTQSFLLADQSRFSDISERLMKTDQDTLNDLIKRMETGELVSPKTENEKNCFKLIQDLDTISGKMHGSTTSKKFMRNEIWSLVNHLGAPSWYITLSPADIQHPICIYFADTKEKFHPSLVEYDERARLVCQNPVAGARFFDFMVKTFLTDVLGAQAENRQGFYGPTSGYYGTVEQQGRLTLHMHMLLWIAGNINPEEMRAKILNEDSEWRKSLLSWLEKCHSGDFLSGTHGDVSARCEQLRVDKSYMDPTQTLPIPPPPLCKVHPENHIQIDCKQCIELQLWDNIYRSTTDDLLLRSNVHSCNKGMKKDGTRKKNKTYASCMDNRWGKCKARFPRPLVPESVIDETGAVTIKKSEPWINTFTHIVTYLLRCNTDVTSLASGTAIKGVIMYVSDYIVKSSLKTHVIFDSIRSVFQKNGEMIGGSLPTKEKARRFMTKVANLLSAKAEMGAPMISMYLLGNPDHYTDHTFVPFYWQPYIQEAQCDFGGENSNSAQPQKVAIIKMRGRIVGLSPVHDYIHRPQEAYNICLYDWIRCYKREKFRKSPNVGKDNTPEICTDDLDNDNSITLEGEEPVIDLFSDAETDTEETRVRDSKNRLLSFKAEHPLSDSHGIRYIKNNVRRVPNFLGANLPRCDKGDRENYCCTMLALFKPWRSGIDLKKADQTWDIAFQNFEFTSEQKRYMLNFNVRYECLDARDDYRAQMKSSDVIAGSWDDENGDEIHDELHVTGPAHIELDDIPFDPFSSGPIQKRRVQDMISIKHMMTRIGWTDPLDIDHVVPQPISFKPDVFKPGIAWEQEIETMKQSILNERIANRLHAGKENDQEQSFNNLKEHVPNTVKVVDKSYGDSYLDKKFHISGASELVDLNVKAYSLNEEQDRAFRIIANHAISDYPEQLRMYLGGMGGTGKTQVIKALTNFFVQRKEAHRFIVVAPTGTAAALLGGATYHSTFGINDRSGPSRVGHIKAKLEGVEYVFLDEVSMLSARDLYRINLQLARVFDRADIPFGGLNMIFSGDFAQLPPAIGGEHVSLYSRSIGVIASDMKSQEESVGKALWHQITTVVILRVNMRQKRQSPDDARLRTALENMRYKSCTPSDIAFLRTRVSSAIPGRSSICDNNFRNMSIITGTNIHKDEINRLGALRFAQETGQTLTDFFSDDSSRITHSDPGEARGVKRVGEITKEMMDGFWSQPPSSTDKHIAGKLSLCIGLPIMIRYNFATEICMTRGQEGFVHGWQSKIGSKGQNMLDTLFVKLKDPPFPVKIMGLPENVVPIFPTTTIVKAMLPNDEKYYINRTQVEVLVNFAMTDFSSQGKTRPDNPSDLNNLRSHQSYYTALSRSATAEGTLILQGFDPKQITGGCSGALRQEFRELELLDEITRLRYIGKLPLHVEGSTRNSVVTSFREWKGNQYVPSTVHSSIRWSTRNPWIESEVLNLEDHLASLEKMREKKLGSKYKSVDKPEKPLPVSTSRLRLCDSSGTRDSEVAKLGIGKPNTQKRRRSSGLPRLLSATSTHPSNKQKFDSLRLPSSTSMLNERHYTAPIGMRWSQNSCAYDSVFTPIYIQWCTNKEFKLQTEFMRRIGSPAVKLLLDGFVRYEAGRDSLENARDAVRRHMAGPNGVVFGEYTSIYAVCSILLKTNEIIWEKFSLCPNGHYAHHSYDSDALLSAAATPFTSIAQWVSTGTEQTTALCSVCQYPNSIRLKFCTTPPLLAFEFSAQPTIGIVHSFSVQLENSIQKNYSLAAVIYYSNNHFTTQIITRDGRVWFYDGMLIADLTVDPTLVCVGSINDTSFSMQVCRGGSPCAAIYCL